MKFKLEKCKRVKYRGLIVDYNVRAFFIGKLVESTSTPFTNGMLRTYIKYGYLIELKGIEVIYKKPLLLWQTIKSKISPHIKRNLITKPSFRNFQPFPPKINDNLFLSLKCRRCQTTKRSSFVSFYCAKCKGICFYCRHCHQMGRISTCTKLLAWNDQNLKINRKNHHVLAWEGKLTYLQQQVSNDLVDSIKRKRNHLIHAVCGAGKTEILYPMIFKALEQNLRVCVATPRTDVVLELYPRFQKAFPKTNIHALYGGAENNNLYAQLIISTTHQLYKYEHAFDVIIVDEADAFPFSYDQTLRHAVMKSKKLKAPITFVTATPSKQLLLDVKALNAYYSHIPIRFHQNLLPIPKIDSLWSYNKLIKKGMLPHKLMQWTKDKIAKREPFIIFFPTIELMNAALPLFQKIDSTILSVSAADPSRKEKVLLLRNEKIKGILSTTILERGVTIKNVQVAVVGAENKVFTSSALIQIAGRVGRNVEFPQGEILFFHHGVSIQMDHAIAEIQRLNKLAKQLINKG